MTTVFGDYQITVVSRWPWPLLSFTNTFHCCFRLEFGQWQAWSNCSVSHIMRPNCVPGQNFEAKGVFLHLPTLWSRFLLPYTLLSLLPSPSQEWTWAPILHSSRGEPLTDLAHSPFWPCCCYGCSVAKSCPTPCDPMDYSTLGSSVLNHLLEPAQIHVYWVSDTI